MVEISAAAAYTRATPAQRAYWFGGRPPFAKEAISYDDVHGRVLPAAASWDTPAPALRPPEPGAVLAALDVLASAAAELDRQQRAELAAEVVEVEAARLTAWRLRNPPPDPAAPAPLSQAEASCRAASDAEVIRRMRE